MIHSPTDSVEDLLRHLLERFPLTVSPKATYDDLSAIHRMQGRAEVIEHIHDLLSVSAEPSSNPDAPPAP